MADQVERCAAGPVAAGSAAPAVAMTDRHVQLVAALEERRAASVEQQARLLAAVRDVSALLQAHRPTDPRG